MSRRCKHRFGTDDDVGIGRQRRRSRRRRRPRACPGASAASSSPTRVTPGAQHAQPRRAARGTDRRAAPRSVPPQEVVARVARKQAETTAAIEHAHGELVRVAQRAGERLGEQPRARRLLPTVDDDHARPARCLDVGGRRFGREVDDRFGLDRRRRRHHASTRAPARGGAFVQHVAGVPGGHTLLLQRFVGVVDDDRGREVGHRRERRDAATDDDTPPGRGAPPRVRARRGGAIGVQRARLRDHGPRAYARAHRRAAPSATHTIVEPSGASSDSTSSRRSCNGGTRNHTARARPARPTR